MSHQLLTTPLHAAHIALGAKMTDFGGYDMPVNYGSQIQEHHAVRSRAGLFDVSHMGVIELSGAQATDFLRYALANDVARLKNPGAGQYSLLLNANGGVVDDLILYRRKSDQYILVVNCANKAKDFRVLEDRARDFSVKLVERPDMGILALQGPQSTEILGLLGEGGWAQAGHLQRFHMTSLDRCHVARTGYTGEDGFEIICPVSQLEKLWSDLLARGAEPTGLGARDTLRLEAGYCLWGHEMNEQISPWQANLGWTIHMADANRNFVGRAALEKQKSEGVPNQLFGLVLEGKGVIRDGMKVFCAAGEGLVTSGTWSPTLQKSIALARLPAGVRAGDEVSIDMRGKPAPARVTAPAFVAHGTPLQAFAE